MKIHLLSRPLENFLRNFFQGRTVIFVDSRLISLISMTSFNLPKAKLQLAFIGRHCVFEVISLV